MQLLAMHLYLVLRWVLSLNRTVLVTLGIALNTLLHGTGTC
jgi:hypothetical protein